MVIDFFYEEFSEQFQSQIFSLYPFISYLLPGWFGCQCSVLTNKSLSGLCSPVHKSQESQTNPAVMQRSLLHSFIKACWLCSIPQRREAHDMKDSIFCSQKKLPGNKGAAKIQYLTQATQLLLQGTWPDGLNTAQWAGWKMWGCSLWPWASRFLSSQLSFHSCFMTELLHTWSKEQALGIRLSYLSDFMQILLVSHTEKTIFFWQFWGQFLSLNVYQCMASHNCSDIFEGFARTSEAASLLLNILPLPLFALKFQTCHPAEESFKIQTHLVELDGN